MNLRYMNITGRRSHRLIGLPRLRDFITEPGGTADLEELVRSPRVSLYCLEDETREAIFVELPDEADLTATPFVFETQYRSALRLVAIPYATFTELGQRLAPVPRLIMVYMTGRCGSTLLSHALNRLESVVSFSEPSAPAQFAYLKPAYLGREQELGDLLEATMRIVCRDFRGKQPTTFAVKPPIETLQAVDLFAARFPQAKNVFMYRDAIGWVASMFHHLQAAWWPPAMPLDRVLALGRTLCNVDPKPLVTYLEEGTRSISPVQGLTIVWLGLMQEYLDVQARGIPMLAVRYADFAAQPKQMLQAIFNYCGLSSWRDDVLQVFDRDSQEGSALRRKNPKEGNKVRFTPEQLEQIRSIVQRHPVLRRSDCVVPGTIGAAGSSIAQ